MRARGIVATVLIAAIGLIAIRAGAGDDPPARARAAAEPVVLTTALVSPMVDLDEQYAIAEENAVKAYLAAENDRQIREYLAWRYEQDVAAWAAAHPPPAPTVTYRGPTSAAPPGGSCNGDFDCFKPCTFGHESGGNYQIVSPGGTYRGAWQFDQGTWNNAVANAGYPEWVGRYANEAPPEIQDAAARWLYEMRGNQPWGGRC